MASSSEFASKIQGALKVKALPKLPTPTPSLPTMRQAVKAMTEAKRLPYEDRAGIRLKQDEELIQDGEPWQQEWTYLTRRQRDRQLRAQVAAREVLRTLYRRASQEPMHQLKELVGQTKWLTHVLMCYDVDHSQLEFAVELVQRVFNAKFK